MKRSRPAMSETTAESAVKRPAPPLARRGARVVLLNWFRELPLVPVIVLLMIGGAIVNPVFFTSSNLIDVATGGAGHGGGGGIPDPAHRQVRHLAARHVRPRTPSGRVAHRPRGQRGPRHAV